jgi:D-alanyl-D-alanine carboxypeptidase (penicillin-binding protein 5/6)
VYKGIAQSTRLGVLNETYITVPGGQYQKLTITTKIPKYLEAPLQKGQQVGDLVIQFDGRTLETQPLYALDTIDKGGYYTCAKDSVRLMFNHWFG